MPQDEKPVKARLYTVTDPIDREIEDLIGGQEGVDVQFNPTSLKVALSNSLKENERSGNTRQAQYVDKSSSTLTVELIFDTTDYEGDEPNAIDVRSKTRRIAETFMTTSPGPNEQRLPKRCLFLWGSFAFVGIMESFDETLDYFSSEGVPLRATVALKLSESRFQFRSREAQAAERETPQLSSRGLDAPVDEANKAAGKDEKEWRDTSMFNGVESPRLPAAPSLAVPSLTAGASLGASASITGGLTAGLSASGAPSGMTGGLSASASAKLTPPSFKYGASASLGTGISGAFSPDTKKVGGLSAGALASGSASLRAEASPAAAGGGAGAGVSLSGTASVGFD